MRLPRACSFLFGILLFTPACGHDALGSIVAPDDPLVDPPLDDEAATFGLPPSREPRGTPLPDIPPPPPPPSGQCTSASDCQGIVENSAGCHAIACVAGVCQADYRRDSETWRVEPRFTDEIFLGASGTPKRAFFDGESFMVWSSLAQGQLGRRLTAKGEVIPGDIVLDPATADLDVVHYRDASGARVVRYYGVTNEPASTSYFGFPYVGGYLLDGAGNPLGGKGPVVYSNGSVCPNWDGTTVEPRVAGSGSSFMVIAGFQYCFAVQGFVFNLATGGRGDVGFDVSLYRIRHARPFAAGSGFLMEAEDKSYMPGGNEIGGSLIGPGGPFTNPAPYNPSFIPATEYVSNCCWDHHTAVWGGDSFMQFYSLAGIQAYYRPLSANGARGAERLLAGAEYGPYMGTVQAGFDSSNFLVVARTAGETLPAQRIRPDGTLLDATPFALTPAGDGVEGAPVLASDRAGRYLVAYRKTDGNVWGRLFSTCP